MINLRATRIDQSFSLEDGGSQNFLVVTLPDGTELKAPIDDDQTDRIIRASMNGSNGASAEEAEPDTFQYSEDGGPVQTVGLASPEQDHANAQALFNEIAGETETEPEGELINWGALPNEMLTVTMKAAFRMLNTPSQLTFEDIQQLANSVAETFGPEEWAKVQEVTSGRAAAPQQPQQRPTVGQVQWADGNPMVSGSVPSRTVPTNDAGYPIVAGEIDPGEVVAGGDTDEDGVGQL
jgi:hypothetical protein